MVVSVVGDNQEWWRWRWSMAWADLAAGKEVIVFELSAAALEGPDRAGRRGDGCVMTLSRRHAVLGSVWG